MMKRSALPIVSALALSSLLAACGGTDNPPNNNPDLATPAPQAKDIVDTAVGAGSFKTLVAAVQAAGLESTLRGAGPFTVFAPTDDAFAKIPEFLRTQLLTPPYKTHLSLILTYHVLGSSVKAADVLGKKQDVATAAGTAKLNVDGSDNKKVVLNGGDATVTSADVAAKNGVIHVIDGVLLPSIADVAGNYKDSTAEFKTLLAAVVAADLAPVVSGKGTFTLFAPTDKAFADLKAALGDATWNKLLADKTKLARVLKYHLLASPAYAKDVKAGAVETVAGATDKLTLAVTAGKVSISDSTAKAANVILTDLPTRTGVIHVIDKVLVPANLGL